MLSFSPPCVVLLACLLSCLEAARLGNESFINATNATDNSSVPYWDDNGTALPAPSNDTSEKIYTSPLTGWGIALIVVICCVIAAMSFKFMLFAAQREKKVKARH
eukprot:TRINITY_DN3648_c0_g1_i2.p1 TRINITY_DN3648_c0_g1~~TRINITY_DN3648_c0_g1_i2.p1  ORF type:complete len:105 (-),score=11.41 TRINITY_DN3648_c0_g1_i2:116-430(-)